MQVENSAPVLVHKPHFFVRWMRRLAYVVCVVLIASGGLFAFARNRVAAYTSANPVAIPKQRLSRVHRAQVDKRLGSISEQVINGPKVRRDFLISTEEINALVHKEPKLRDKIFVKIVDNQLKADVCFPTDLLPGGAGRYFNGEVTIQPAIENGKLTLTVVDAVVDGKPVPELWMKLVRERNFAKPLYNDREISQILANVQGLIIEPYGMRFMLHDAANAKQLVLQARNNDHFQIQ